MNEKQRKTFAIMAQRYTEATTATRATARAALIREGIRLPNGRLSPNYGGKAEAGDQPRRKAVATAS
ncbi:hypothetical protein [Roseomonas mucosa]|uniref:hypothetical protein n=1 Tax=Roseomonas mucosa TaxID=207340 RepID=UPI00123BE3CF|nr:hypothetical protein [Roseomonas mucosa]MBS5905180.1 hypothetical protein [Acetobacteraceae bacterium]MDT8312675.1 hypothetical protein [Roseomonas mucosa]MDT8351237.1 hypothetical protein [Roseomonas mucosa]MDT8360172.1 hypothetical protein [Roseomonas mucosa]QET92899.1 hypothetical protein FOB66_08740 [Roseomonas mucosa]